LYIFGNDNDDAIYGGIVFPFKAAALGPLILEKPAIMDNIEGSYLFKFSVRKLEWAQNFSNM
jgi:hypothetical protein